MIWQTVPYRRNTPTISFLKCALDSLGDENHISQVENWFSEHYNTRYALVTASGRQAMVLSLASYGFQKDDEVMFPCLTFYILPSLVKQLGLKPTFVNCSDDFTIDTKELESKITTRTRAIIATHIFGNACQIDTIRKIADKHGIVVIEDCAHSHAVTYRGQSLGTFGQASFFSFQNRKPINAFGGGVLLTNDEAIYNFAREAVSVQERSMLAIFPKLLLNYTELFLTNRYTYSVTAWLLRNDEYRSRILSIYQKLHHKNVDARKAFTNFQARIALEQLRSLHETNSERVRKAALYTDGLKLAESLHTPDPAAHNFYSYVILAREKALSRLLFNQLFHDGIDVGNGESILRNCGNMYDPYGDYRKSQDLLERMIELPMYRQLRDCDIQKTIKCISRLCQ